MKVFAIAGWSGSGKTTLLEKLIPCFTRQGLRVSTIKHAHHGFDLDRPGKDSYRHRAAGASQVLMLSSHRWVLMHELRDAAEPSVAEQLQLLDAQGTDLVLIEGFKAAAVPKIEVFRAENGKMPLWPDSEHIVAVASNDPIDCPRPVFRLDDSAAISQFILNYDNSAYLPWIAATDTDLS